MNTVIVPVDFSDISLNAARYAVKLLTGHPEVQIILYHAYDNPYAEENALENLGKFKEELLQNREANITVLAEHGDFLRSAVRIGLLHKTNQFPENLHRDHLTLG